MTYKSFLKRVTADVDYLNAEASDYINYHGRRFYMTYLECAKHLKKGDKVLSVGAGLSSIEKILAEDIGVEVTVLDFPGEIELRKRYYDFLGFKSVAADLSQNSISLPANHYNMLIFSEVVEHVTKSIYEQMIVFKPFTQTNGFVVVTTPNVGSIMHIVKLLLMKPILETADLTFAPATVENVGIHKREYMPSEVVAAFERMNYKHVVTKFFNYTYPKTLGLKFLYTIGTIIPRFRFGMMIIAQKR